MSLPLETKEMAVQELSVPEQVGLERTLAAWAVYLPAARPADEFVTRLGQQLVMTRKREYERQHRNARRLRVAGIIGGVASLVGGVVVWVLWRQRRHRPEGPTACLQAPSASGIKLLLRAHHPARS